MDERDLIAPGEHEDELAAQASEGEFEPEAPNENWLVSYADLMTLLFGFFAMLYLTQTLAPPPPAVPKAAETQEQKQETKKEPEKPVGAVPEPPPVSRGVPDLPPMPPSSQAGGNRGFQVAELFPPTLLVAMALVVVFYVALFLLGRRRHRIIVDPVTGTAAVRKVPILQVGAAAQQPLTPAQLALKAKEEEILRLDGPDEILEVEEAHGEVAHMTDERWLISYADMMTLLFGFYAMLYLMGPNFEAVKSSMDQAFSRMRAPQKPIEVPNVPLVPMAEAPTAPPATLAETSTQTRTTPETLAQTQTAAQTATQTVAEAPAVPRPRPTPTREELEKMEEERKANLKERLAQRAQEAAEAEADARALGRAGGQGGGSSAPGEGPGSGMKGKGGKGVGGGRGSGVGAGITDAVGSAICSEGALTTYSPTCWGSGFFGCLTSGQLRATGGLNGEGGALEFYCVGGKTRVCLTYEHCPWRGGGSYSRDDYPNGFPESSASPSVMECSPSGLAINAPGRPGFMAECRDRPMCNFARIECDDMGVLHIR